MSISTKCTCGHYLCKVCNESVKEVKDLAFYKANAEEDYMKVPISVLRYITELEKVAFRDTNIKTK